MIAQVVAAEMMRSSPNPIVSRGASETACFVLKATELQRGYFLEPQTYGLRRDTAINELDDVRWDCSRPGWEGYQAAPVSEEAIENALRFLESLPGETGEPSVAAEPDGSISFEWHHDPYHTLSVSITSHAELYYAALLGQRVRHGSEPFFGEPPAELITLIREVAS